MDNYNFTKGKWTIDEYNFGVNEFGVKVFSISKEDKKEICMADVYGNIANALLISKAPEMLEKLSEIVNILDIKCTDGCVNKTWGDFQNGNGEDVGLEIDKFIKDTKQLIKEATEL